MKSFVLVYLLVAMTSFGCRTRPFPVAMRGNVDGNVNMNGSIAGDVTMNGNVQTSFKTDNTASAYKMIVVQGPPTCGARVAIVDVDGLLVQQNISGIGSMGENPVAMFREKLNAIAADPSVNAVVLRIDSPGGGVAAVDQMCHDLVRFKTTRGVPVVACLLGTGTSGAYLLSTYADQIIAQPTSIVGGIGVILNLYNMEDAMGQYNIAAIPIKSGDKIDGGSPVRAMQPAEREALQRIADHFQLRFTGQVRASRPALLPPVGDAAVEAWFDGRVVTGDEAATASLVDAVGYLDDAIDRAAAMASIVLPASVVMLRRDNDRAHTTLDVTPNTSSLNSLIPISVPGLERSRLPSFLYLWQLDPTVTASLR